MSTNTQKLSDRLGNGTGLGPMVTTRGAAGAATPNVDLLKLLKSIKQIVVAGGAVDTDLVATGIEMGDEIVGVIHLQSIASPVESNFVDVTDEAAITADGVIQLTTTVTTNDTLLVTFVDLT